MNRIKETVLIVAGVLAGLFLSGPAASAAASLMANPSSQTFYLNDQRISLEAYEIGGSNYVKLRDVGQAVGFGVAYDAVTNAVTIHPDKPYTEEVEGSSQTFGRAERQRRAELLPGPAVIFYSKMGLGD